MRKVGISQREIAESMGIHRNTVGRWLKPSVAESPDFLQFMQLARLLECSARWLSGLSDDPTPPSYISGQEMEWLDVLRGLRPVEREAILEAAKEAKALGARV